MVLLPILATTYGRGLPKEGECTLETITITDCPINGPDVFFPHPSDCHWLFHCINGEAYCKECPGDLHWNVEIETSDYPYNAGCEVKKDLPLTCPAGDVPKCPFPDPVYSVFFPHPNEGHWFFHCSNGVAYCKECPADLHWNVEIETCDYP
jgi:hypothetical protein